MFAPFLGPKIRLVQETRRMNQGGLAIRTLTLNPGAEVALFIHSSSIGRRE